MAYLRRITVDGIRVEGERATRIVDEALGKDPRGGDHGVLPSLIVATTVIAGLSSLAAAALVMKLGWPIGWSMMAVSLLVAPLVALLWIHIYLRFHRRKLRRAMRRLGLELCERCGYWLQGLTGVEDGKCPECGAPRVGGQSDSSPFVTS